ncbi:MAG: hypothetical protein QOE96_2646 [Blastocatellia bacterium]|jgi:hypothetical protein|nr:hypothetical protein [Blastocatellia bacterium]
MFIERVHSPLAPFEGAGGFLNGKQGSCFPLLRTEPGAGRNRFYKHFTLPE